MYFPRTAEKEIAHLSENFNDQRSNVALSCVNSIKP